MKTVLIATDFSKASHNATLYGVQLAKEINASVVLFNAYTIPTPAARLGVSISRYSVRIQVEQKLKAEATRVQYINMPVAESVCDEGKAEDAIISIAQEKNADFIIVGMKGSGKSLRKVFGSTATSLTKKTNTPVIIVPESAKYRIPKNIIFASEAIIDSDKNLPEYLKQILKLFKSKLNVVSVVKQEVQQGVQQKETHYSDKVAHTFDTSFERLVNADVRHALNDFIKTHPGDMLVMMPHKHHWIERIFKKSETKNMIFHIHIPLLVLPERFFSMPNETKVPNYSNN